MPIGFLALAAGLCIAIWFCDERPVRIILIFALVMNLSAAGVALANGDLPAFQKFERWMSGGDPSYHAD